MTSGTDVKIEDLPYSFIGYFVFITILVIIATPTKFENKHREQIQMSDNEK